MTSMNEILLEYGSIQNYLLSFSSVDKQIWKTSIKSEKWSMAEIISHIIFWDNFIIERLTKIQNNEELLNANINVDEFNKKAAEYANSGISKNELLKELEETRKQLLLLLEMFSEDDFIINHIIQDKEQSIQSYMIAMVEHDKHHIKQIVKFLNEVV